jgi:hypothetical protein
MQHTITTAAILSLAVSIGAFCVVSGEAQVRTKSEKALSPKDIRELERQLVVAGEPTLDSKTREAITNYLLGSLPSRAGAVLAELRNKDFNDLKLLKFIENPCKSPIMQIDCRDVSGPQAKLLIDFVYFEKESKLAQERDQMREKREQAERMEDTEEASASRRIAFGSMAISFLSLIVSGLTYVRKRRESGSSLQTDT